MTCHDIAMHWFPVKSSTFYSSKSSQHFIFIWDFHLQDTCVSISNTIKYCNLLNIVLKLLLLQFVYATKKLCSLLGLVSVFQRGRTLSEKCIWSQGIGPYTPISRHIVGIVRIGPYTVYIIHLYRHTVPPSFLTVFFIPTALHGVLAELVPIAIPPLWCDM